MRPSFTSGSRPKRGAALAALLLLLPLCAAAAQDPRGAPPPDPDAPQAPAQDAPPAPAPEPAPEQVPEPAPEPPPEPAVEQVLARRLADVVAVREGPTSPERVLYYFNPTVTLLEGGQLEQGSGGHSELALAGGGIIAMHAGGHIQLLRLSPEGDVLKVPLITRLEVRGGDRPLELQLPGGTLCHVELNDVMFVQVEPGRLRIRNQGHAPIEVQGDLRLSRDPAEGQATGKLELAVGEEVLMPLFTVAGADDGSVTELWGWLAVRHGRGATVSMDGDRLAVSSDPDSPEPLEVLNVRGVLTLAAAGQRLVIHDPLHAERPPEPPPAPVREETPPVTPELQEPPEPLGDIDGAGEPPAGDDGANGEGGEAGDNDEDGDNGEDGGQGEEEKP